MMTKRGAPERGHQNTQGKAMDKAILMAVRLEAAGAQIKEVSECRERVDGCVFITDFVSVQVATYGSFARVTKEENVVFTHGPDRTQGDIDLLMQDISEAIA